MKETQKGLHPETVKSWAIQNESKNPLEFLKRVYLSKNSTSGEAKELVPEKNGNRE